MKSSLKQAFENLEIIIVKLDDTVQKYIKCMRKLYSIHYIESYNRGEINDVERNALETQTTQLKIDIQTLFEEFLEHVKILSEKIDNCELLDFNEINDLNFSHLEILRHYKNVVDGFRQLKQRYKEYDFSWIDFSKMEHQKMKLNIAIKNCNEKLLGNYNIQLLDVFEMEKEVFQFLNNYDWQPSWEI